MDGKRGKRDAGDALDAAIDWMVLLRSGEATAAQRQQFEQWTATSPDHLAAWQCVAGNLDRAIAPLRHNDGARAAERALLAPRLSRRRLLGGALAMAGVAASGGLVANRFTPLTQLAADLHTDTGERRTLVLPDGGNLVLNARSAVDVDFGAGRRQLHLLAGELIADGRGDPSVPLSISTAHGDVVSSGRVLVRRRQSHSLALTLEGSATVLSRNGDSATLVAGEARSFRRDGFGPLQRGQLARASWIDGMLTAQDDPLGDVIDAVRAYRPGLIRISPAAAELRVLGAFPIDDTDALLQSLAQTLPIRVDTWRGGWLTVIDLA